MMETEPAEFEQPPGPRMIKVVAVILSAALVFSYLVAYAVMNALANTGVIPPLPRDVDPRPRWMVIVFTGLVAAMGTSAILLRWVSGRQLSRIDRMADAEDSTD